MEKIYSFVASVWGPQFLIGLGLGLTIGGLCMVLAGYFSHGDVTKVFD